MIDSNGIDIQFDFRTDAKGKDPDSHSPTLRRYHKDLWSKPLPNGALFNLVDTTPNIYLHHRSDIGEFALSSDAITHSYKDAYKKDMGPIISQVAPSEVEALYNHGCTIGAYIVFPQNKVDGKMTINGYRGIHPRIKDRFDLTLECIRLHYEGDISPLSEVLDRYADFFGLFSDFRGYVDFFLLQDLVADDYSSVKFHIPFEGFDKSPLPIDPDQYLLYKESTLHFIQARAQRMLKR